MRTRKNRPRMMLLGLVSAWLAGILMLPASLCLSLDPMVAAWWGFEGAPFGLIAAVALLALSLAIYWPALTHTGDLLLSREQRVLEALMRDRE